MEAERRALETGAEGETMRARDAARKALPGTPERTLRDQLNARGNELLDTILAEKAAALPGGAANAIDPQARTRCRCHRGCGNCPQAAVQR